MCLRLSPRRQLEKDGSEQREKKISADRMPPGLCCISPDSLNLSAGQSVDRFSIENQPERHPLARADTLC